MIDLSTIQHLEINSPDYQGLKFMVISNERTDTGLGILNAPIMPLPTLLLGLFGTDATFYLNSVSSYDPETGDTVENTPQPVLAKVYPEAYTTEDKGAIPEVLDGDIKVYVPGEAFGYTNIALLTLQVRETGSIAARIS